MYLSLLIKANHYHNLVFITNLYISLWFYQNKYTYFLMVI